jgi:hypothetical protein
MQKKIKRDEWRAMFLSMSIGDVIEEKPLDSVASARTLSREFGRFSFILQPSGNYRIERVSDKGEISLRGKIYKEMRRAAIAFSLEGYKNQRHNVMQYVRKWNVANNQIWTAVETETGYTFTRNLAQEMVQPLVNALTSLIGIEFELQMLIKVIAKRYKIAPSV